MCIKIVDLFLTAEARNNNGKLSHQYDNTDVIVLLEEEDNYGVKKTIKYVATFFTYKNINEQKIQNHKSGDYLRGKYFFNKNMVILDNCSKDTINEVVNHLIDEGEFREAFRRI